MHPDQDLQALVCPRCGEDAGEADYCAGCGLHLATQEQLPSRGAWLRREPDARAPVRRSGDRDAGVESSNLVDQGVVFYRKGDSRRTKYDAATTRVAAHRSRPVIIAAMVVVAVAVALVAIFATSGSSLNARVSACLGYSVSGCKVVGSAVGHSYGICGSSLFTEDSAGNIAC